MKQSVAEFLLCPCPENEDRAECSCALLGGRVIARLRNNKQIICLQVGYIKFDFILMAVYVCA